jgi:hypothetical protein
MNFLPRLRLSDGAIEALKWFALACMTADHVNKYLIRPLIPELFYAGRLAMPLFMIVLAYNLARPEAMQRGAYSRTGSRLAAFGIAASVPFIALGHLYAGWWPLNILFTLLVTTLAIYFLDRGGFFGFAFSALVFFIGGSLVEFWWPAVALGIATWYYVRQPTWLAAIAIVVSLAMLWFVNTNHWALGALPLLWLATRLDVDVPRLRWTFYAYYPLHLGLLWLAYALNGGYFVRS